MLFPFSAVYLAALPETGRARALPPGEPKLIVRAIRRVGLPAGDIFVAVPVGTTGLRLEQLRGPRVTAERFGSWLIVETDGPFADRAAILAAASRSLRESRAAATGPLPGGLVAYYAHSIEVLRLAACTLMTSGGAGCVPS